MDDPILSTKDLAKRYGDIKAVDGVSFQIAEGESYGLLGPNGAGKTTTISMICGLVKRDAGEIVIAGKKVTNGSIAVKKEIGYVPQQIALYPDLTGEENLRFFGRMYGLSGKDLGGRIESVLSLVGLAERKRHKVSTYSGGMQRRLNIAAGLLHRPRLLILDEPTVGVDPQSRNAILENVHGLKSEGLAVLYTTHYMEEAERLCDRVGIIDHGKIIGEGTRRELVSRIGQRDRIELTASGELETFARKAKELEGVEEVTVTESGLELLCREGRRLLPRLLEAAERSGVEVTSVDVLEPDLEAVFLHLTGRALRD